MFTYAMSLNPANDKGSNVFISINDEYKGYFCIEQLVPASRGQNGG
nr:hypothetical protein [Bacteroidota bacterium]